jgi:hypothetical protein
LKYVISFPYSKPEPEQSVGVMDISDYWQMRQFYRVVGADS